MNTTITAGKTLANYSERETIAHKNEWRDSGTQSVKSTNIFDWTDLHTVSQVENNDIVARTDKDTLLLESALTHDSPNSTTTEICTPIQVRSLYNTELPVAPKKSCLKRVVSCFIKRPDSQIKSVSFKRPSSGSDASRKGCFSSQTVLESPTESPSKSKPLDPPELDQVEEGKMSSNEGKYGYSERKETALDSRDLNKNEGVNHVQEGKMSFNEAKYSYSERKETALDSRDLNKNEDMNHVQEGKMSFNEAKYSYSERKETALDSRDLNKNEDMNQIEEGKVRFKEVKYVYSERKETALLLERRRPSSSGPACKRVVNELAFLQKNRFKHQVSFQLGKHGAQESITEQTLGLNLPKPGAFLVRRESILTKSFFPKLTSGVYLNLVHEQVKTEEVQEKNTPSVETYGIRIDGPFRKGNIGSRSWHSGNFTKESNRSLKDKNRRGSVNDITNYRIRASAITRFDVGGQGSECVRRESFITDSDFLRRESMTIIDNVQGETPSFDFGCQESACVRRESQIAGTDFFHRQSATIIDDIQGGTMTSSNDTRIQGSVPLSTDAKLRDSVNITNDCNEQESGRSETIENISSEQPEDFTTVSGELESNPKNERDEKPDPGPESCPRGNVDIPEVKDGKEQGGMSNSESAELPGSLPEAAELRVVENEQADCSSVLLSAVLTSETTNVSSTDMTNETGEVIHGDQKEEMAPSNLPEESTRSLLSTPSLTEEVKLPDEMQWELPKRGPRKTGKGKKKKNQFNSKKDEANTEREAGGKKTAINLREDPMLAKVRKKNKNVGKFTCEPEARPNAVCFDLQGSDVTHGQVMAEVNRLLKSFPEVKVESIQFFHRAVVNNEPEMDNRWVITTNSIEGRNRLSGSNLVIGGQEFPLRRYDDVVGTEYQQFVRMENFAKMMNGKSITS